MHNITYISNADRERLVQLNEDIRSCTTIEEQQQIRAEIVELEAKRKRLVDCDMNECTELRTFVYDKFNKLNRAGKGSLAHQFKIMLHQIEMRQNVLHGEMSIAEQKRKAEKPTHHVSETVDEIKKARSGKSNKTKAKSGTTSSRWTTGIGSLD